MTHRARVLLFLFLINCPGLMADNFCLSLLYQLPFVLILIPFMFPDFWLIANMSHSYLSGLQAILQDNCIK